MTLMITDVNIVQNLKLTNSSNDYFNQVKSWGNVEFEKSVM